MKFLNQNDLYFRLGDIVPSGTTPTNDMLSYSLTVNDINTQTTLRQYSGQIFYYSNDQKIYYDFLCDMAVQDFDPTIQPNTQEFIPVVEVYFANSTNTITASTQVARFILTEDMNKTTVESYICPQNDNTCNVNPSLFDCDMPVVLAGQNYPAMLYTGVYEPQGEMIFCGCGSDYLITKENSVYLFQMLNGDDDICAESPSVVPNNYHIVGNCDAPYSLIWYDPQGFFQSQAFWGNETNDFQHNTIKNLQGYESKYETKADRSWNLKSDWVRNSKTYRSLFISPVIWLYDGATGNYHRVLIKDTSWTDTKSKKSHRFSLTVNNNISNIYK